MNETFEIKTCGSCCVHSYIHVLVLDPWTNKV